MSASPSPQPHNPSSSATGAAAGGFSLFPHPSASQPKPLPSNNPYRKTTPRPRAATPQSMTAGDEKDLVEFPSPPRSTGRTTPQSYHHQRNNTPPSPARGHRRHPSADMLYRTASVRSATATGNRSPQEGPRRDLSRQEFVASGAGRSESPLPPAPAPVHLAQSSSSHPVQQPHSLDQVPGRTETAFSDAPTLVRSQSTKSRSSIAKRPFVDGYGGAEGGVDEPGIPQTALRSIFPTYNHALPLDRQEYFPTQQSPTHIPHDVISRQPYNPVGVDGGRSPPPLGSAGQDNSRHHHQHHIRNSTHHHSHSHSLSLSHPGPSAVGPSSSSSVAPAFAGPSGTSRTDIPPINTTTAIASSSSNAPVRTQPQPQPQTQYHPSQSHNQAQGQGHIKPPSPPSTSHQHHHPHSHPRQRVYEQAPDPVPSTLDELRGLWKVANGWKASPSEGRPYTLHVTSEKDAPVYTLSAANGQPFYNIRLDPRANTAYVIMARHDPSKLYKIPKSTLQAAAAAAAANPAAMDSPESSAYPFCPASIGAPSMTGGGGILSPKSPMRPLTPTAATSLPVNTGTKHWLEVLTTTLEEPSRRLPPNDGLVALLYPLQAAKMALARPDDEVTVLTAERECARLVFDPDATAAGSDPTGGGGGGVHYLVHPSLALPFRIAVDRCPSRCRTEYLLEHVESPRHLARLVRDGTGGGFLEIDTAVASRVDAVYIVDVAVSALLLVAAEDEKGRKMELFEPPPPPAALLREGRRSSSRISMASRRSRREEKRASSSRGERKFESLEVDIESQASSLAKMSLGTGKDEKLPRSVRALVKLVTWFFKAVVWAIMFAFRTLAALIRGLARCCGEKA